MSLSQITKIKVDWLLSKRIGKTCWFCLFSFIKAQVRSIRVLSIMSTHIQLSRRDKIFFSQPNCTQVKMKMFYSVSFTKVHNNKYSISTSLKKYLCR
jgi:hypothetical protein